MSKKITTVQVAKAENQAPKKTDAPKKVNREQVFTVLTYLFPVIFFVLLEGGLRLFGYGETYPLFVESAPNSPYLTQNKDVGKRYFRNTKTVPTPNNDFFRAEKSDATKRIVILGESSAAGYPYYRGASFPKILEQSLRKMSPNTDFEFINVSMAAINSYTLNDYTAEILAIKPDAILIYTGHNEYYGALGGGSSESLGKSPFLINLFLKLQNFRTVQLIRSVMSWVMGWTGGAPQEGTLMRQMVKEQSIPLDSDLYKLGIHQFKSNLTDIVGAYRAENIPVLVSTLAANEGDHYPFISEKSDINRLQEAKNLLAKKDTLAAAGILKGLSQQFPKSAEVWYLYAKSIEKNDVNAARTAFFKSKELDLLRFRAPEAFNQIIKEVAKEKGAILVDGQAALRKVNKKGYIGKEVMLEHLHPNLEGYTYLAQAFINPLAQTFGIKNCTSCTFADMQKEVLFSAPDAIMSGWRIQELLNQWPFKPVGYKNNINIQPKTQEEIVAASLYNGGNWFELINNLSGWYKKEGKLDQAIYHSKVLADGYPLEAASFFSTATLLLEAERYAEAKTQLNRIRNVAPPEETYKYLTDAGAALMEKGKFEEAKEFYTSGLEIYPNPTGYKMMGAIYAQRGQQNKSVKDLEEAAVYLEKSIKMEANDTQALFNLAGVYALIKKWDKAHSTIDKVIQLQPGNTEAIMLKRQLNSISNGLK